MGDYYKIKKILLILIIVLTIIRIFKTSNVFASEAVEVTPTWTDGSYTVVSDNSFMVLLQDNLNIQNAFIIQLERSYFKDNASDTLKQNIHDLAVQLFYWMSASSGTRFVYFNYVNDSNYSQVGFSYTLIGKNQINNIINADAIVESGYKIPNQPFYRITRNSTYQMYYFNPFTGVSTGFNSGTFDVPVGTLGAYSENWLSFFDKMGLTGVSPDSYQNLLQSIEETTELNYTQNYYTKQAVQNTYSYLTNDNVEEITSLGISQPQVTEQVDLTDVLDSLEALLTNETYTTKFFTITLPNGRGSTFALSPELLENNLNRVGGQNIVSIIHAVWYIGLYGWYIFSLLGIYGKLLTGDLFHLVKGCSPVTNLVKMSVGTISGGKF